MKFCHLMYVPFTGLGLYHGYRGDVWLKNRILIFKQFVLPSLLNQTNRNFTLWLSFRPQERYNPQVQELKSYLGANRAIKTHFTYGGVCFWDDKYDDDDLLGRLHITLPQMSSVVGDADFVFMTVQPSDDMYLSQFIEKTQKYFEESEDDVIGFKQGYIMNYATGSIAEYNPTTTPPFYTIKFSREVFLNPTLHYNFIGPYKSHEYVKDYLPSWYYWERMFVVGVHGENISTNWKHSFKGRLLDKDERKEVLNKAGIKFHPIIIKKDLYRRTMKIILNILPKTVQYLIIKMLSGRIATYVKSYSYFNL